MKLSRAWPVVLIALLLLVAVFSATFYYAYNYSKDSGTFRDTFGVATSIFSALTLLFLIIAVLYQREEISLVKDERDDTRKILNSQEKLNDTQKEALRNQTQEQAFYSLIRLISDETANLEQIDSSLEASAMGLAKFRMGSSKLARAAAQAHKVIKEKYDNGELENFSPIQDEELLQCQTLVLQLRMQSYSDSTFQGMGGMGHVGFELGG